MNSAVKGDSLATTEEKQLIPQFSNYKYIFTDGKINSLGIVSLHQICRGSSVNIEFTVNVEQKVCM